MKHLKTQTSFEVVFKLILNMHLIVIYNYQDELEVYMILEINFES